MSSCNVKDNILYIDCFAGIAGDMFLASIIDITAGEDYFRSELEKITLDNYGLKIFRDKRGGISGLRLDVISSEGQRHRHLADIEEIIESSSLSDRVKLETVNAFTLLANAEAAVHGEPVENVHFHEVGAVDSIIDITGAMIMLEYLGWPEVRFSPLNVGSGTVKCAHGILPVPAPATAELLKGFEVYSSGDPMERVTPTGAVLVKALSGKSDSKYPFGKIEKTGIGLGSRNGELPNLLRASLFKSSEARIRDRGAEISANIDDMLPQDLSFAMEKLFEAGALDVWFEHIQMKKNRPAVKLCCLTNENNIAAVADSMLKYTTTLGVRQTAVDRITLKRRIDVFNTPLGMIHIKSALSDGRIIKQMPEFEDVRKIAEEHGMPPSEVRAMVSGEKFAPLKDTPEEEPDLDCHKSSDEGHEPKHTH